MGGSMGPVLANIFMCHMEKKWLEECPNTFKPFMYRRYVDDTFLLFENLDQINLFHNYLNSRHPNIKFTLEHEKNDQLPFIGINVTHADLRFTTTVYRKPTDTGLGLQYTSFNQTSFKSNSIMTLLHRCFMICSTWTLFHQQVEYLRTYYSNNGYPSAIFWRCVHKFLHRIHYPPSTSYNVPRDIHYVSLPFLGHHSYSLRNSLQSLFKFHYPQINVRIILSNKNTIGSLFPTKDRVPFTLRSNVIYKYQCESDECSSSYIGSTTRRLGERVCEHLGVSFLTGARLSNARSSILDHSRDTGHPILKDSFKIIGGCKADDNILLLESVFIKYMRPTLNNMDSAHPLQLV